MSDTELSWVQRVNLSRRHIESLLCRGCIDFGVEGTWQTCLGLATASDCCGEVVNRKTPLMPGQVVYGSRGIRPGLHGPGRWPVVPTVKGSFQPLGRCSWYVAVIHAREARCRNGRSRLLVRLR